MFHRLVKTVSISIIILLLSFTAVSARVYIDIESPYAKQFPVAIPTFKFLGGENATEPALSLRKTLCDDLEFTGLFTILDPKTYLVTLSSMGMTAVSTNFQAWDMIGSEFLIKGGYTYQGKTFTCELRMFDVKKGVMLVGKRYSGTKDDIRIMAHKFADEVMLRVTGERSFFQTKIAYISTASGHKELWISDFDGQKARKLTEYRSITNFPAWSPNGQQIVFTSYKDGHPFIYRYDLITGTTKKLISFKGLNISPKYSPDGKQLIATLSKDKSDPDLFLTTARGKIIKKLTNTTGIDGEGTFSPDGTKIAFVSKRHGSPQVFVMDLQSGQTRRLTFVGKYNTSPCWSPRGDRIAYVEMQFNQFNVITIAPDGTDRQQLTLDQGDNEYPVWSPDGRMIMFSSNRSGKYAIYVMTANGGHVKRITNSNGEQTSPSWSGRLWK